ALLLHNGPEFIEAAAALGYLGAVAVQVGYRLKPREVAFLLADSGARALVVHAAYAAGAAQALGEDVGKPLGLVRERCVMVGEGARPEGFVDYDRLLAAGDPSAPPRVREGGYGELMTYTSGTTGRVKGARRAFRDTGYGPILNF